MGHNHATITIITTVRRISNVHFCSIFEIIGGYWTNSVAILSDAVHNLGDSISLRMSWYLDSKSKATTENDFHICPKDLLWSRKEMHVVYIPISSSIPIFEISCTRCTSFGRNYVTTSIIEKETISCYRT